MLVVYLFCFFLVGYFLYQPTCLVFITTPFILRSSLFVLDALYYSILSVPTIETTSTVYYLLSTISEKCGLIFDIFVHVYSLSIHSSS